MWASQSWIRVLRQDVAPVASAYLVFLAIFAWYLRRRRHPGPPSASTIAGPPRWPALARSVAGTVLGGYAFFALVILIFYLVLGGQPGNFISQSLAQGAVLAFGVVLPAFAILIWCRSVRRQHLHRAPDLPARDTDPMSQGR
jgi:hypothetical protein